MYLLRMNETTSRRIAGVSGIVGTVLSGVIGAIPPPPPLGATARDVVDYFSRHQLDFLVLNYLGVLGLVPIFIVIAYTVGLVRRREGEGGWLWLLLLGTGGFLCAAGFGVLAMVQGVAYIAPEVAPETARAFADVTALWFGLMFLPVVSYALTFAWCVLATRIWPAWIAWLSIVAAILAFVASVGTIVTKGALAPGGPATLVAFLAFLIFLLAYSLLMLFRAPRDSDPSAST